jgi:hypothetical protein
VITTAWRAAMFGRAFARRPSSAAPAVQEVLIAMIGGELSRAIGGLMRTGRSFGGAKFLDNMRTRRGVSLYAGAHDAAGSSAEPAACV